MKELKVVYNGIKPIACGTSASGQVGTFRAVFSFSPDWDAYPARTAVFVAGGEPVRKVLDRDNACEVPEEITKNGGRILVGAYGNAKDASGRTLRYPGENTCVLIPEGASAHAVDPTPEEVTLYEQMLARLVGIENEARTAADAANTAAERANEAAKRAEEIQSGGGGGIAKETDPTVPDWAKQPTKPKYTAAEVGALSASELPKAINTALAQAAESGKFDGEPGHTPERGKDYWTPDDLAAMVQDVLNALPTWKGGSY